MHLPDWLIKPDSLLAIALFLLGVVVSLFSVEIRRLFSIPPRKWTGWRLSRAKYRLNVIVRLHNDPYHLLLYFMWGVALTGWQSVISILPAVFLTKMITLITGKTPPSPYDYSYFLMVVSGNIFGWMLILRRTVDDLYYYDERKKYLEDKIQKLQPQIPSLSIVAKADSSSGNP